MGVSIITPAYDAGRFLPDTIESVLGQPFRDWEMVVVDDGSMDETVPLARSYAGQDPRIRLIRQKHGGASRARNRGLAESDPAHEYVVFLDAGDIWEPSALQTLYETIETHKGAVGAHGIGGYIDEDGAPIPQQELAQTQKHRRGVLFDEQGRAKVVDWPADAATTFAVLAFQRCIVPTGLAIWRKSAVGLAGGFDPDLIYFEDWDLWLRISLLGEIAFIDRRIVRYREHPANFVYDQLFMRQQDERMRQRTIRMKGLSTDQRLLAVLCYCYWQQNHCRVRLRWARDCFQKGDFIEATKRIRHAARSGAGYTRWSLVAQSLGR